MKNSKEQAGQPKLKALVIMIYFEKKVIISLILFCSVLAQRDPMSHRTFRSLQSYNDYIKIPAHID